MDSRTKRKLLKGFWCYLTIKIARRFLILPSHDYYICKQIGQCMRRQATQKLLAYYLLTMSCHHLLILSNSRNLTQWKTEPLVKNYTKFGRYPKYLINNKNSYQFTLISRDKLKTRKTFIFLRQEEDNHQQWWLERFLRLHANVKQENEENSTDPTIC